MSNPCAIREYSSKIGDCGQPSAMPMKRQAAHALVSSYYSLTYYVVGFEQ